MKKIAAAFGTFVLLLIMCFSFASAEETKTDKLVINGGDDFVSLLKVNTLKFDVYDGAGATERASNTAPKGAKYKFVYSYNGSWKSGEWGVIKDFDSADSAKWTPKKSGNCKIYVDVKSGNREYTKVFDVNVKRAWTYDGIDAAKEMIVNKTSKISAKAKGDSTLQYKFVYSYNGSWKSGEWGVIKHFSSSNSTNFTPKKLGKCDIYVDIKDAYGNVETKKVTVESVLSWKHEGVVTGGEIEFLDSAQLFADVSGETNELEYKFVFSHEGGWKYWGVIQHFSKSSSIKWTPEKAGRYDIYVDIKDKDGNIITKQAPIKVVDDFSFSKIKILDNSGATVSKIKTGESVNVSPVVSGAVKRLNYKFVYSRNGSWKNGEWGVIKHFSSSNSSKFSSQKPGKYDLYVDIKDAKGNITTKKTKIEIVPYYLEIKTSAKKLNVGDKFTVNISGAPRGAKFKVITNYNNSKNWYVEKTNMTDSTVELIAKHPGELKVCVDSTYDNYTFTEFSPVVQVNSTWNFDSITCKSSAEMGEAVSVKANVSGNTKGLKYKFVCSYHGGWQHWCVFRHFGSINSASFTPQRHGDHKIYVDISDEYGNIVTKSVPLTVNSDWEFVSVMTSARNIDGGGKAVIKPNIKGNTKGLKYKYVYSFNYGWSKWGVINEGTKTQMDFYPKFIGPNRVYVDVTDSQGYTVTKYVDLMYQNGMLPVCSYDWFSVMNARLPKGSICTVIDVYTGKRFKIKRLFGNKHMDSEPLTAADTAVLKSIYGGEWSWDRRPIVVVDEENQAAFAASMNGMPHGTAKTDQSIFDNNFNGHFCIHFKNSRTHGSNRADSLHQAAVNTAARLGKIKFY